MVAKQVVSLEFVPGFNESIVQKLCAPTAKRRPGKAGTASVRFKGGIDQAFLEGLSPSFLLATGLAGAAASARFIENRSSERPVT